MNITLYTIGYERAEPDDFVDTLRQAGVEHLLDIRDVPASRRRGFSKTALSAMLEESGIAYTHLKPLGDPKPGREAMRNGDYDQFLRIYQSHVAQPEGQSAIVDAVEFASNRPAALMCYERDPRYCHRKIVAEMMQKMVPLSVKHLGVSHVQRGARAIEEQFAYSGG